MSPVRGLQRCSQGSVVEMWCFGEFTGSSLPCSSLLETMVVGLVLLGIPFPPLNPWSDDEAWCAMLFALAFTTSQRGRPFEDVSASWTLLHALLCPNNVWWSLPGGCVCTRACPHGSHRPAPFHRSIELSDRTARAARSTPWLEVRSGCCSAPFGQAWFTLSGLQGLESSRKRCWRVHGGS